MTQPNYPCMVNPTHMDNSDIYGRELATTTNIGLMTTVAVGLDQCLTQDRHRQTDIQRDREGQGEREY